MILVQFCLGRGGGGGPGRLQVEFKGTKVSAKKRSHHSGYICTANRKTTNKRLFLYGSQHDKMNILAI